MPSSWPHLPTAAFRGERKLIEAHLTECDDCYEALVEIAAITAQIARPTAPVARRDADPARAAVHLWIGGALAAAASVILFSSVMGRTGPIRSSWRLRLAQAHPRAARLGSAV
jgi:hypothetical protein